MSTSITVVCYKSKKLSNGNSPLMLRITKDRKLKYLSLGISIETHFWDFEKNKPKANCPNKDLINKVILKKISEYNEKVIEKTANDEEYTATSLVEENKKRIQAKTVEDFYQELISTLKSKGNIGNSYAYLNSYNTLKNFNMGKKLLYTFSHINTTFLKELEEWMREKGNKDTTLSYQFRTLRATFNRAIEAKVVAKEKNPFQEYKLSKFNTKTAKRALSKTDILKIIDSDCTGKSKLRTLAHSIFTFSYLCGGISFVDIANLTVDNVIEGRLIYRRQKTHGEINLVLSEKALKQISKYKTYQNDAGYLFPILHQKRHITPMQKSNRVHKICHQVNQELRILAQELNISAEVTTYVARHSFASILKKSGVNIGIISEALGHQNIKTTEIYLSKFDNNQIDDAMRNLL